MMDDILAKKNRHLFLEEKDNQNNSFIGNVNTLVNNLDDVNTVADNITGVKLTGESIESVNTVAANIEDINNASTNIDTVKTFNDNVNNGTMQYLLEAFTTSLNEQGNAWEIRLTQLGESILATTSAFNYSTVVTVSSDIPANGTLILPNSMKYKVGTHMLMVSWNGTVCYAGEQYDEVGAYGVWATSITLKQPAKAGDKIQLRIVALTDQSSYVDMTEAAINASQFVASGSNTERYLPEFLGDIVNVKNFGAVGNGINDDTTAFQSAIASGKAVFVPEGIYKLNTDLNGVFCGIGNSIFTGGTVNGSTILRGIAYKNSDIINVKDFGAKGDGITNDAEAIQAAINAAEGKTVFFPKGKYRVITTIPAQMPSGGNPITITIPSNRRLVGDIGSEIEHYQSTGRYYAGVVFALRGSNISISGLILTEQIDQWAEGDSHNSWYTAVNFGASRDPSFSEWTSTYSYENINIENCIFNGFFMGVNFQHPDTQSDYATLKNISIHNCKFYNKNATSSGPVNFRAYTTNIVSTERVFSNITITRCYAVGFKTSSDWNFVSVAHVSVSDCVSEDNTYAACEIENSNRDIKINNLTCINCAKGVWIDDSANVLISGLYVKNTKETYDVAGGSSRLVGDGLYITISGANSEYTGDLITGIHVTNFDFHNARLAITKYSNSDTTDAAFGDINFVNGRIYTDADDGSLSGATSGVYVFCTNTNTPNINLNNISVRGFSEKHFFIGRCKKAVLTNCSSSRITSSTSIGLVKSVSADKVFCINCDIASYPDSSSASNFVTINCLENGTPVPDSYSGVINYIRGTGTYYNSISANSGSLMTYNNGTVSSLLLRMSSGNNSNWNKVALNPSYDNFIPSVYNTYSLGTQNFPWSSVYAGTGSIQTSDARKKDSIALPNDALMRAWGKVRFKVFQFKDAIAKKGSEARLHVGVIAQEVHDAFASEGLDASRYGLYCYDAWGDEYEDIIVVDAPEIRDEKTGELIESEKRHIEHRLICAAGDAYAVRYEEALALECAYQRWLGKQRDAKIEALMQKISALENNH